MHFSFCRLQACSSCECTHWPHAAYQLSAVQVVSPTAPMLGRVLAMARAPWGLLYLVRKHAFETRVCGDRARYAYAHMLYTARPSMQVFVFDTATISTFHRRVFWGPVRAEKKVPLFDIRRGLCGPFPLFVNVGGHGSVVCGPCEKRFHPCTIARALSVIQH